MIKKLIFGLSFLALASAMPTMAQVTIGSGQAPATGALLDLKEKTDGSSDKGLGMPRVALTKLKPTTPAELSASIGGTGNWDLTEHIGLAIYNVKNAVWDPATCKMDGAGPAGLYVWDGSQWQGIGVEMPANTDIADPLESETATTLTDREGNTYAISTFGAAGTWMTENLRTTTAPGLRAMTEDADGSYTDMHYAYPMVDGAYVPLASRAPGSWTTREGIFYNWQATMNRNTCTTDQQAQGEAAEQTEVIQGICPFGWHVPSDKEWNQLEQIISEDAASYAEGYPVGSGGTWTETYPDAAALRGNHAMLLQSATPVGGATPGYSKPASSGGFDLLVAGTASLGSAINYGVGGYLWSSSSLNGNSAWGRSVGSGHASVVRYTNDRIALFSVRCKKN